MKQFLQTALLLSLLIGFGPGLLRLSRGLLPGVCTPVTCRAEAPVEEPEKPEPDRKDEKKDRDLETEDEE